MGNIVSLNTNNNNNIENQKLINTLDFIASNYIFTMNFDNMKKLYNKSYCDNLVLVTSDIIDKYYNQIQIEEIHNRIIYGENKTFFIQKDHLDKIPTKQICDKIAKFYVKIGHLFSSILMTISPEYVYIDPLTGNNVTKNLQNKNEIPDNVQPKIIYNNLCNKRINILLGNSNTNINDNLIDEPGIPELIHLYYDTDYNIQTSLFSGMSEQNRQQYYNDLKIFYKTFTQNNELPSNITRFSDIKIKDYNSIVYSIPDDIDINDNNLDQEDNILIIKYAKNIKKMISRINHIQEKLLNIINKIFIYEDSENNQIRISPSLTETILQNYINETRELIVDLYLNCEEDFVEGIQIFEALIENIIFKTTINQIKNLENDIQQLYSTDTSSTNNNDIFFPTQLLFNGLI